MDPRVKQQFEHPVEAVFDPPVGEVFDPIAALRDLFDAEVKPDIVHRPAHYTQFAIEPITFIMQNDLPFWKGNIIKYACRAGAKIYDGMDAVQSEITDLEKVRRYAEMRINQLKGEMEI